MGVVGGVARCPSLEAEMYGCKYTGVRTSVPTLGSSEASSPQRFKCISIMGSSNGAMQLSALVVGRVRFWKFYCIIYSYIVNS